ncbi:MAG: tetratricopeptide repeat protein [Treponema sp.]|jgi:tetratricopeptide (TPR) repeat protein|nr:tetratricopeptide repeat protein [Treponema sp.]
MNLIAVIIIILATGVGFLAVFLVKTIILPRRAAAAETYLNKNKNLQAIKAGKAAVEKDPKDTEAHYYLGKALLAENRIEQALREFKSVSRLGIEGKNIPETEFRQTIAKLYLQCNESEEALKEYLLLIKLNPENPEYFYWTGKIFSDRNRTDLAEQYLGKAVSLDPREGRYHFALGAALYQNKKSREAVTALENALKTDLSNGQIHYYLGKIHKDSKDYAGAVPSFEKAARDQEYRIRALVELGSCYMSLKMVDKAIPELERAVNAVKDEAEPDSLYARYFLAMCFEKKQEYPRAIAQWDKIYAQKKNFRDVGEKLTQYQQYRQAAD